MRFLPAFNGLNQFPRGSNLKRTHIYPVQTMHHSFVSFNTDYSYGRHLVLKIRFCQIVVEVAWLPTTSFRLIHVWLDQQKAKMAIMALISLQRSRNPFLVHFASSICLLLAKMHLLLFAWGFFVDKRGRTLCGWGWGRAVTVKKAGQIEEEEVFFSTRNQKEASFLSLGPHRVASIRVNLEGFVHYLLLHKA